MTQKRLLLLLLALLLPWLLLNCTKEKVEEIPTTTIPIVTSPTIETTSVSKNTGSKYTIKYDMAFKRWGEFYFPFEEWTWWKAQGIAESNLDPKAVSWCGAQGVMQIMPNTGVGLGLKNPWDAEESIQMGIKYDGQVDKYFKEITQPERRKFMFAGYNAGMGNINKARKLAVSDKWSDTSLKLPQITGKANTAETTGYVARIHKLKEVI